MPPHTPSPQLHTWGHYILTLGHKNVSLRCLRDEPPNTTPGLIDARTKGTWLHLGNIWVSALSFLLLRWWLLWQQAGIYPPPLWRDGAPFWSRGLGFGFTNKAVFTLCCGMHEYASLGSLWKHSRTVLCCYCVFYIYFLFWWIHSFCRISVFPEQQCIWQV